MGFLVFNRNQNDNDDDFSLNFLMPTRLSLRSIAFFFLVVFIAMLIKNYNASLYKLTIYHHIFSWDIVYIFIFILLILPHGKISFTLAMDSSSCCMPHSSFGFLLHGEINYAACGFLSPDKNVAIWHLALTMNA